MIIFQATSKWAPNNYQTSDSRGALQHSHGERSKGKHPFEVGCVAENPQTQDEPRGGGSEFLVDVDCNCFSSLL